MKLHHTAQKQLQKMPSKEALSLLYALLQYETKPQGYTKWLENRAGYRIRIGKYRAIFEFQNTEMVIFTIIKDKSPQYKGP